MAKVKFIDKGDRRESAKGNAFWNVKTADKAGTVFFDAQVGTEYDLIETYSEKFGNYTWSQPKANGAGGFQKKGGGSFAPNRLTLRSSALLAAAHTVEKIDGIVKRENVEALAEKYFAWINKAEEPKQEAVI